MIFLLLSGYAKIHAAPAADSTAAHSPVGGGATFKLSGYLQAQFQHAEAKSIKSFSGGNFPEGVSNRFMVRRGRLKAVFFTAPTASIQSSLVLQLDATEKGIAPKDVYGQISETRWGLLSLAAGLFSRPFGYELNLSSQNRESPERGRMSQLLMKGERDVGAMLSVHPKKLSGWQLDVGLFNGPGPSAPQDYDNYKDLIGRLHYSPLPVAGKMQLSGGISGYFGFVESDSNVIYKYLKYKSVFAADTAAANKGSALPRRNAGADVQWRIPNKKGCTELRAEVITGTQVGTRSSSETPEALNQPLAVRSFTGGYFYLLQHLGSKQHQFVLKYDFYDPNTAAKGRALSAASGFNNADIAYQTFGGGYIWYLSPQVKLTAWYDHVVNEKTSLPGFEKDIPDDVVTLRLQVGF